MKGKHIGYTSWSTKYRGGILSRLNWDVIIQDIEYFAYHLSEEIGNPESEKLHYLYREDTWFVCRRDCPENEITENLIPCSRQSLFSRQWGIKLYETSYIRTKWDDSHLYTGARYEITLNGEKFYESACGSINGGYVAAMSIINELDDHPSEIGTIDWDRKLVGTKIWYRNEPAFIDHVNKNDGTMWIIPDTSLIEKFSTPESWKQDSDWMDYSEYENGLITNIWSEDVTWFRQ